MRIVIAEDSAVVRAGLVEILADSGHEVVAAVGNAEDLLAVVDEHHPDAAVVDVRMPPGYTDEGLRAAIAIRRDHPKTGVLVFSQYIETRYTAELLTNVTKHSGATHATLEAIHMSGLLRVRVSDTGCGGARVDASGGLAGLAERIKTVDGRLQLSSPPGGPTAVTVELPSHA